MICHHTCPLSVTLLSRSSDLALKVIYIIIGTVGVLDNLFVLIIFIFFIKITEKVKTLLFVLRKYILIISEVFVHMRRTSAQGLDDTLH